MDPTNQRAVSRSSNGSSPLETDIGMYYCRQYASGSHLSICLVLADGVAVVKSRRWKKGRVNKGGNAKTIDC